MEQSFRKPRDGRPTRHLYLANCGAAKGDTRESVAAAIAELAPGAQLDEVLLGDAGVSYVSFASCEGAAEAARRLQEQRRWVVRFAERDDGASKVLLPGSVASTEAVCVPGLELYPDFVSADEERELLEAVDGRPWDSSIKRRVQHYGHAFDYARLSLGMCSRALPDFCDGLLASLEKVGLRPDQLTVNEYQPGVGIASHVDAHSSFQDGICALTLGSGIVMEFKRPEPSREGGKVSVGKHHRLAPPPGTAAEQKNVWLPARSLLVLRGEARYAWQHGIAWRKTDCLVDGVARPRSRRVSMTFRSARLTPCDCQWPLMCDAQNPEAHVLPSRLGQAAEEAPVQEN